MAQPLPTVSGSHLPQLTLASARVRPGNAHCRIASSIDAASGRPQRLGAETRLLDLLVPHGPGLGTVVSR